MQVWGRRGMVSSMHPDATLAGLDVLKAGGNAVDAAVALAATVAVTSHNWSGIAGDTVWLIHDATKGETTSLDGYGTCPAGLTNECLAAHFGLSENDHALREEPDGIRDRGVIASMLPGTPAAWVQAWRRYGTRDFEELLARAVALAEDGIAVSAYLGGSLHDMQAKLAGFEASRRIFFNPDGEPLREGDTLVQTDLARTLRRFGRDPENEFVSGETAQAILACGKRGGSPIIAADLAGYRPVWREPIRGAYRGRNLVSTPPPTSGAHVIQALAILEHFSLSELGYHSPESLHVIIEALRHALADRRAFGGDPDFAAVDLAQLLDPQRAADGARSIRAGSPARRKGDRPSTAGGTTHFVVVDPAGNIVTGTQTIGNDFGCGEVADGTGLVMNDRTWWMALSEGPNVVAPGRRANIGHAPTIVFDGAAPCMALGSPGGFGIVQYVVQVIVNVLDYGLDLQSAIDAPRFRIQDLTGAVSCESHFEPATLDALETYGHRVERLPAWSDRVGGVEGAFRSGPDGNLLGGHDVRRNSLAAGF
jgi:gamma-glutamyltranspeptidase/glutathione hydrolase